MNIDLNCDMGEGIGMDQEIMPYITSANIACGAHAGNEQTMDEAVQLAKKFGVAVGAHPSFPDRVDFGRKAMDLSPEEIYYHVKTQIEELLFYCHKQEEPMCHVKPHGALYNVAAKNRKVADAIAEAVYDIDPSLILYGLAGSELLEAGRKKGLQVAAEAFADRTYQADGTLTPRTESNALVHTTNEAIVQVRQMVEKGYVIATNGESVDLEVDTICLHGDSEHAVEFAKTLREALDTTGIKVAPLAKGRR